ncbi:hypothetical protein [Ferrovibrio terrae]|uniref:hypothetical protein n=1 Tax=Ferrovibrio terrae TaxID=2594003 RepID=UPI00313789C2
MSKVRRIDFNPDEFLAGVFGLFNPTQFAAWWLVCTYCYSEGRPIREDDRLYDKIARAVKMRRPDVIKAIEYAVSIEKLQRTVDEHGVWLSQKRVEKELKAARKRIEGPSKPTRTELKDQCIQREDEEGTEIPVAAPALPTTTTNTNTINNAESAGIPLDRLAIEDFDSIRVEVFGPEQARAYPNSLDLVTARRWIEQGVQRTTWMAVFRAKQLQRRAGAQRPIDTMNYFDQAILDAHGAASRPFQPMAAAGGSTMRHDRTGRGAENGFAVIIREANDGN